MPIFLCEIRTEQHSGQKREVPSDPAEHFGTKLPDFHGQFLPFQDEFMRRPKIQRFVLYKQLQSDLISLTQRNESEI